MSASRRAWSCSATPRAKGIPVSGEATPHHLTLTDECIKTYSTNYKMNPPLRSEEDRLALIEGVADGTITVIATDHAPHTRTAKLVEFDYAPFGIIGLETALPLCYTELVAKGVIDLAALVKLFTTGPAEVLGVENYSLAEGRPADIVIFDPARKYTIDADQIQVEFAQHAVQRARSRVPRSGARWSTGKWSTAKNEDAWRTFCPESSNSATPCTGFRRWPGRNSKPRS